MIQVEYLYTSMYGSYYLPCEILKVDENGNYTILYFDPVLEENVKQENVSVDRLILPTFVGPM